MEQKPTEQRPIFAIKKRRIISSVNCVLIVFVLGASMTWHSHENIHELWFVRVKSIWKWAMLGTKERSFLRLPDCFTPFEKCWKSTKSMDLWTIWSEWAISSEFRVVPASKTVNIWVWLASDMARVRLCFTPRQFNFKLAISLWEKLAMSRSQWPKCVFKTILL